jgi:hypothetical protein
MQDFQEVIEDSQLINAMYDDTPKPVESWFSAPLEEVQQYEERLETECPDERSMSFVCNTSLGFFLVGKHAWDYGII